MSGKSWRRVLAALPRTVSPKQRRRQRQQVPERLAQRRRRLASRTSAARSEAQREQRARTVAASSDVSSLSCGRKVTNAPGRRCAGLGSASHAVAAAPPPTLKLGASARRPPGAAMPRRSSGGAGRAGDAVVPFYVRCARANCHIWPEECLRDTRPLHFSLLSCPLSRAEVVMRTCMLQQSALHAAPRVRRTSASAQARADAAATPERLRRRALLASLGGLLAARLAPPALASGSPYDDVLPDVGVLNGCVLRQVPLSAPPSHERPQPPADMPVHVQLRVDEQQEQRSVHLAVGGCAKPEDCKGSS